MLYVRNVIIYRKIEYKELQKFIGNCVNYMYGISGFTEKLNIRNCVDVTGNCVHGMNGMS